VAKGSTAYGWNDPSKREKKPGRCTSEKPNISTILLKELMAGPTD
jgi:hypothetical protein